MKTSQINRNPVKLIDFVPALSGLIGKTALVTSFAVVWAAELNITNPDFVFENVRLEMIIGSIITLLAAILLSDIAPSGTLAPLIVLIPSMAAFGVHPFILSLLVGLIGFFSIKTRLFHRLISLSGNISKASLTLTIGISGVIMSVQKLIDYFQNHLSAFGLLLLLLSVLYICLRKKNKMWMIIPTGAVISLIVTAFYGIVPDLSGTICLPSFSPSYWWNDMWGIGYGLHIVTILKTIPYALFVLLLWTIDTVSIQTMLEASYQPQEERVEINLNRSFIITSLRNILGGILGGAQTSALWRSFLIPLFMAKRPLRTASIIMGILGIAAGFGAVPIKILSFPPLIWSVLLYGIFLPFVLVGLQNLKASKNNFDRLTVLATAAAGILINPILTWIFSLLYEKVLKKKLTK